MGSPKLQKDPYFHDKFGDGDPYIHGKYGDGVPIFTGSPNSYDTGSRQIFQHFLHVCMIIYIMFNNNYK